jgi:hypothetical protein
MISYNNPITNNIFLILSPLIGEMLASGVLKSQTKKMNITEETVGKEHLPHLAAEIKNGLILFIGSEAASKVADKIQSIY